LAASAAEARAASAAKAQQPPPTPPQQTPGAQRTAGAHSRPSRPLPISPEANARVAEQVRAEITEALRAQQSRYWAQLPTSEAKSTSSQTATRDSTQQQATLERPGEEAAAAGEVAPAGPLHLRVARALLRGLKRLAELLANPSQ
jgi:hypothetical protein